MTFFWPLIFGATTQRSAGPTLLHVNAIFRVARWLISSIRIDPGPGVSAIAWMMLMDNVRGLHLRRGRVVLPPGAHPFPTSLARHNRVMPAWLLQLAVFNAGGSRSRRNPSHRWLVHGSPLRGIWGPSSFPINRALRIEDRVIDGRVPSLPLYQRVLFCAWMR